MSYRPHLLHNLYLNLPPRFRPIPFPAVRTISILILVNICVWVAVAIVLRYHPYLASSATLAYTLGLRHALDADHISAIDLMTRRLIASGSKPTTVGTYFSLGHSTIVIITCIVVAATSGALEKRFDGFSKVGGIIGTGISAAVLIILGIGNLWILVLLVKNMKRLLRGEQSTAEEVDGFKLEGGGLLARAFKGVFKLIDRPWKMYPLGVLFGLGFDTSSEIAVLGIASIQAISGTSIWLILIFPLLFTSGMCLVDTTDGALMMTLYTSTAFARDMIAILYYSIVLTAITVIVAICIGVIQLLTLILNVASPTGRFWNGVAIAGNEFEIIGGSICGAFVVFGFASVLMYKPWRRRVDKQRMLHAAPEELELQNVESKDNKAIDSISAQELQI